MMPNSIEDWTYADFKTLMLLYAANSDFRITAEENAIIEKETSGPRGKEIRALFDQNSDFENINLILSFRDRFFSSEADKQKLLDEVCALCNADQDYSSVERAVIAVLEKVM
jgi:hypothetical protein